MGISFTTDPADSYRRQARRLRHELRDEPAALHRSLQALSARHDSVAQPTRSQVWRADAGRDHVQDLVAATVLKMEGPILRYPHRLALLKQAKSAGIAQFDANLIITAVQHRMGERIVPENRKPRTWVRTLTIALICEFWIVAGLYWMFTT